MAKQRTPDKEYPAVNIHYNQPDNPRAKRWTTVRSANGKRFNTNVTGGSFKGMRRTG